MLDLFPYTTSIEQLVKFRVSVFKISKKALILANPYFGEKEPIFYINKFFKKLINFILLMKKCYIEWALLYIAGHGRGHSLRKDDSCEIWLSMLNYLQISLMTFGWGVAPTRRVLKGFVPVTNRPLR